MTYICPKCIKDDHLRKDLKLRLEPCDYCESPGPSVSLIDVAIACDEVIDTHFEPTHWDASVRIFEREPSGSDLEDTLRLLNAVPESAINDLMEDIQEVWFDHDTMDSKYSHEDDENEPFFRLRSDLGSSLSASWQRMEASLRYEVRYLNPDVLHVLDNILGDLHLVRTSDQSPVIVKAGPAFEINHLYRARVFQTEAPLLEALEHPARLLGTPAAGHNQAGRMNAKGQPTFYGASNIDVAIAEVRPPVGAWIISARFNLTRDIHLLDLRKLEQIRLDPDVSLFDPISIEKAQRRDFLRTLSARLILPVMPELQDHSYLITQVVADYLATHKQGTIDGIIYPSVQRSDEVIAGFNVALFSKSSFVEESTGTPIGQAHLWEYDADGPDRYPAPEVWLSNKISSPEHSRTNMQYESNQKIPATLSLVREEVEVHQVQGVKFDTSSTGVKFRPH